MGLGSVVQTARAGGQTELPESLRAMANHKLKNFKRSDSFNLASGRNRFFTQETEKKLEVKEEVKEEHAAPPVAEYDTVEFRRLAAYLRELSDITKRKEEAVYVTLTPELETLKLRAEEAEQRSLGDTFFGVDGLRNNEAANREAMGAEDALSASREEDDRADERRVFVEKWMELEKKASKERRRRHEERARAQYMAAFAKATSSEEIMAYVWPKMPAEVLDAPMLEEDAEPDAPAPSPAKARAVPAYKRTEEERQGRKPFRCGSWKHQAGAGRLPKRPKDPLGPLEAAPGGPGPFRLDASLGQADSVFSIPPRTPAPPTVISSQWSSQASELEYVRSRSVGAFGGGASLGDPKPRKAPRAAEQTSVKPAEAERLDAMVARALGGDVPPSTSRKSSRGGAGYVISTFQPAEADARPLHLNRPSTAATTRPRAPPDHAVFKAMRDFPPMRKAVAAYKPIDLVHGLEFCEFDELDDYFAEIIDANFLYAKGK
ncbi:hypothetical protein SO694_00071163 [Aureococcus anophagefferens]|uniref:Bromo domain-containing protein n=1 Tax=Aureococcus anophagefferens TaxID=44056 RepID=A0ABR1FI70_AURAN